MSAPASKRPASLARAERAALGAMGLGLALMFLVPTPWAFRAGFFLVLTATAAHIVVSHLRSGP